MLRSVHPFMDYVAIALPVLLILAVLAAGVVTVVRRSAVFATVVLSLIALFAATVVGPMRPAQASTPESTIRIATMNLGLSWFSDNDAGFFVFQQEPDFLVGIELSESHDTEFQSRFDFHQADIITLESQQSNEQALTPEGKSFRRNGLPSIGIYSNYPIEELDDPIADVIDGGLPGFRVRVTTNDGPFILYGLHVPRPYPGNGFYEVSVAEHVAMVEAIHTAIEAETEPVVVAGDLNTVDRGQSYRTLTSTLDDAMRESGWAVPTSDRDFPRPLLFARLDHILISDELCAENGSSHDTRYADHRALVVDVGPCA